MKACGESEMAWTRQRSRAVGPRRQELFLTSNHPGDGEPMASVQEIRQRLPRQRIEALRSTSEPLLVGRAGAEMWLYCFAEA